MDWLSAWLRSVVLVILLAMVVELLLPSQAMQRYVRTVLSLFLLLTLLQPVLKLIDPQRTVDRLLAGALLPSSGTTGGMASLADVRQHAAGLQQAQAAQARELAASRAAELMKGQIEQTAGVTVRSIQVALEEGEAGAAIIRAVSATIDPAMAPPKAASGEASAARPGGTTEAVKPIAPVAIQAIRPIGSTALPAGALTQASEALTPELARKKTQIAMLLQQDWQLTASQIELTMLGEADAAGRK